MALGRVQHRHAMIGVCRISRLFPFLYLVSLCIGSYFYWQLRLSSMEAMTVAQNCDSQSCKSPSCTSGELVQSPSPIYNLHPPHINSSTVPKLAVVAFLQNESPFLREWLEHYIAEGASYFIILEHEDSNEEQDRIARILEPYHSSGIAELHKVETADQNQNTQLHMYNEVALPIVKRHAFDWVLTVDLDEYVYGRFGKTFAEALGEQPIDSGMVCLPWKMFTTMGALWEPRCVVPFHVHRLPATEKLTYVKCAHRVDRLARLAIHGQYDKNGRKTGSQKKSTETWLAAQPFHLNHYRAHSVEHHYKKRSKQGRPTGMPMNGKGRVADFQRGWDNNHTLLWDVELSAKQSWKGLGCSPQPWDSEIDDFNDVLKASDGNAVVDLSEPMCPRKDECTTSTS
jgi:hypothetical protein